jgi:hypothetical protein
VGAIYSESICILCRHNIACLWPAVSPKFVALLRGGGGVETLGNRAGSLPTGWRTLCPRPPGPKASAPDCCQDFYRPVQATVSLRGHRWLVRNAKKGSQPVSRYPGDSWQKFERNRVIIGYFRKGFYKRSYYIELESSGLRWNVEPEPEHMAMLDKRVCATGFRVGYKMLTLSHMTLAE